MNIISDPADYIDAIIITELSMQQDDKEPYKLYVEEGWMSEKDIKLIIKELQRMIKIRKTGVIK